MLGWRSAAKEVPLTVSFLGLIIYMKNLLDSDWLRAVQFKCNTSVKGVIPVQIAHGNYGL